MHCCLATMTTSVYSRSLVLPNTECYRSSSSILTIRDPSLFLILVLIIVIDTQTPLQLQNFNNTEKNEIIDGSLSQMTSCEAAIVSLSKCDLILN